MSANLSDLLRPLLALAGKATEIHAQTEQAVKDLSFDPENAALWVKVGFLHKQEGHAAFSPELVKAMVKALVAGEKLVKDILPNEPKNWPFYTEVIQGHFTLAKALDAAHSELASLLRK